MLTPGLNFLLGKVVRLKQSNGESKCEITVPSQTKRESIFHFQMLTELQAIEIYRKKIEFMSKAGSEQINPLQIFASESIMVGKVYGVSPRTVQNIWNRRSWAYATKQFWMCESCEVGKQRFIPSDEVKQINSMHLPYLTNRLSDQSAESSKHRRPGRPKGSRDKQPRGKTEVYRTGGEIIDPLKDYPKKTSQLPAADFPACAGQFLTNELSMQQPEELGTTWYANLE